MTPSALPASFFARPVLEVARDLVGCVVAPRRARPGAIVETEAYHEREPACHAYVGLTPRTSSRCSARPATAYVYRSYGIHALLNAVCEPEGVGAAVLIRALEPLEGLDAMRARRGRAARGGPLLGPGQADAGARHRASSSTRRACATARSLIEPPAAPADARASSAGRAIGITKAAELPWRFCAAGSRTSRARWPPGCARRPRDGAIAAAR